MIILQSQKSLNPIEWHGNGEIDVVPLQSWPSRN